jgi:hypothetical protein
VLKPLKTISVESLNSLFTYASYEKKVEKSSTLQAVGLADQTSGGFGAWFDGVWYIIFEGKPILGISFVVKLLKS